MLLLFAAGTNAAILHSRGPLATRRAPRHACKPSFDRAWIVIIVCGRWIAYVKFRHAADIRSHHVSHRSSDFSTLIATAALAHHGWSSFDETKPIYLEGVVKNVKWQTRTRR